MLATLQRRLKLGSSRRPHTSAVSPSVSQPTPTELVSPRVTPHQLHQQLPALELETSDNEHKLPYHINSLPNDVLASILQETNPRCPSFVPALPFRTYPYALMRMTQVCKHWHNVAIDHPHLWSVLDDSERQGFDLFLARSKSAPLVVYIRADFEWSLNRIVSHMDRVKELHVEQEFASAMDDAVSCLLRLPPAPQLDSFTLMGQWFPSMLTTSTPLIDSRDIRLFEQCLPTLRNLSTGPWFSSGYLTGLRSLCLSLDAASSWSTVIPLPSLSDLLDCLRRNPRLEILIIVDRVGHNTLTWEYTTSHDPVHLPHLDMLTIGNAPPSMVACVLACFDLACHTSISIDDVWWEYHNDEITHIGHVFPNDTISLPILQTANRIQCLQVEDSQLHLLATGPQDQYIHIQGPLVHRSDTSWDHLHASYARTLSWLMTAFSPSNLVELCLGSSETTEPTHPTSLWDDLLEHVSFLRKLTLIHCDIRPVLSALSTPGPGAVSPMLSIIHLVHVHDLQEVIYDIPPMLTARRELGSYLRRLDIMMRYLDEIHRTSWAAQCHPTSVSLSMGEIQTVLMVPPKQYLSVEQQTALMR